MRPATVTTVYSGSTSPCFWLISCLSTARNSTATYRHHLRMVGADCCVSSRNRCAVLIEAANRECPHLARRTRRLGGGSGVGVEPTCLAHVGMMRIDPKSLGTGRANGKPTG